eukprot:4869181-Pyramimonas_sp.AAC.1
MMVESAQRRPCPCGIASGANEFMGQTYSTGLKILSGRRQSHFRRHVPIVHNGAQKAVIRDHLVITALSQAGEPHRSGCSCSGGGHRP